VSKKAILGIVSFNEKNSSEVLIRTEVAQCNASIKAERAQLSRTLHNEFTTENKP
jgi:hypothetical protein